MPSPTNFGRPDFEWLRDQVFGLCEDTEDRYGGAPSDLDGVQGAYSRGRYAEAKSIRRAIGEVAAERIRDAELAERLVGSVPYILEWRDDHGVCVGGRFDGWLMWHHPDGQWVSVRKLSRVDLFQEGC